MSLNKVILIGNLGKDPEVRSIPNGSTVANFSIATTERYTDKQGQKVDKTEWHRIVFFGKVAEIAGKYLKKGSMVCIEGKIVTRSYDKDGVKIYTTEIIGNELRMLGGKQQDNSGFEAAPASYQSSTPQPDDDLPF